MPRVATFFSGIGVLLLAGLVAGTFTACGESGNGKVAEEAKAAAPPVIAALDRFKAAKKSYPTTLDQLVSEYLPAVPGCRTGEAKPRMAYSLDESSGQYELACPASTLMRYRYRSSTGQWDLTD